MGERLECHPNVNPGQFQTDPLPAGRDGGCHRSGKGPDALEEDISAVESQTAFVAMWFAPEMTSAYDEGIAPAVEELGYRPVRISGRSLARLNDEILPSSLVDAIIALARLDDDIIAVHLFGSRARGDCRPDSDVDWAIETAGSTEGERLASYICLETKAEWLVLGDPFGLTMDIDQYEPASGGIVAPAVEDHGIELFRQNA